MPDCNTCKAKFQSTRPVWGATFDARLLRYGVDISIHAPRVGRDRGDFEMAVMRVISIHAPRVGRDGLSAKTDCRNFTFQSTRPVWGATWTCAPAASAQRFQSTRPVWGATRQTQTQPRQQPFQSTRPVWGATISCHGRPPARRYFNPRAPCGARRRIRVKRRLVHDISIHAPRVGRDCKTQNFRSVQSHFNPRAPCGARRVSGVPVLMAARFQSTRPVWGATAWKPERFAAF